MNDYIIYKGCLIEKIGTMFNVWRDGKIVHFERFHSEERTKVLSEIVTKLDEGEF